MSSSDPEDQYDVPFNHKRPFGAGIKRKRIDFVPQSAAHVTTPGVDAKPSRPAHEAYLSIVLPQTGQCDDSQSQSNGIEHQPPHADNSDAAGTARHEPRRLCAICKLAIPTNAEKNHSPHESSLAHQVCLEHSHPPSSLDRRRKGLAYLESYGWDPDARVGLGASGDGRLYPVRAEQKEGNLGIGAAAVVQKEESNKPVRLSGKEFKKAQEDAKKKEERMRSLMYGRDDVNKYLGIEL